MLVKAAPGSTQITVNRAQTHVSLDACLALSLSCTPVPSQYLGMLWWACVFCLCPGVFVVCWVLVRSGRARLEDVRRMGDAGRLVAARERFSARVCGEFGSRSDMLRRGPKAGD